MCGRLAALRGRQTAYQCRPRSTCQLGGLAPAARRTASGDLRWSPALLLRRRPAAAAGLVPGGPGVRRYLVRRGVERPGDPLTIALIRLTGAGSRDGST